jgi:CRISPR-associated protein (TIGR03986 family)
MPDWAHLVSHDVPFKDGISGVIDYTLTNATPLCVGGEQKQIDGQPSLVQWAKDPKGNPVIPGSSLKGMIRNVLEIASFGKFNAIDDNHFSFRDISNSDTKYAMEIHESNTQAYWLKFDESKGIWTLDKAEHTILFHDEFNSYSKCKIENIAFKQPAEKKYNQWPLSSPAIKFNIADREIEGTKGNQVNIQRAINLGKGELEGYPVFSGFRPGSRKYTLTRLNFSYMFYKQEGAPKTFSNSNSLVQKLFNNHDKDLVSELKNNPNKIHGIPVFAREVSNKIIALGLAKMPRKLYNMSVSDVAKQSQTMAFSDNIFDLSELMMGTSRDKGFSLKSRVAFCDGVCVDNKGVNVSSAVILGEPKASYLSAYLEQKSNKNNIVMNELNQYEKTSQLKGWKRYPTQSKFTSHLPKDIVDKVNVQSKIELMQVDSKFKGKIVFHNLKEVELGALLWVLKFQDKKSTAFHSLGHGRPLGAGAVSFSEIKLEAQSNKKTEVNSVDTLVNLYIDCMNNVHPGLDENSWLESTQVRHLLSFSNQENNKEKNLSYMPLKTEKNANNMSYVSSVQGRNKQVLPDWEDREISLIRDDELTCSLPSSFALGRLNDLIKDMEKNDELFDAEIKSLKNVEAENELEKDKQKKAEELSKLSPGMQLIKILKDKIDLVPQPEKPPLIRSALVEFIDDNYDQSSALELYQLARKCDYHKKPAKRAKTQKVELSNLLDKYGIRV